MDIKNDLIIYLNKHINGLKEYCKGKHPDENNNEKYFIEILEEIKNKVNII